MEKTIEELRNEINAAILAADAAMDDLHNAQNNLSNVKRRKNPTEADIKSAEEKVKNCEAKAKAEAEKVKKLKKEMAAVTSEKRKKTAVPNPTSGGKKKRNWTVILNVILFICLGLAVIYILANRPSKAESTQTSMTSTQQTTGATESEALPAEVEDDAATKSLELDRNAATEITAAGSNFSEAVSAGNSSADNQDQEIAALKAATSKFYAGGRPDIGVYNTEEGKPGSSLNETESWLDENCVFEPAAAGAREYLLRVFDPAISANLVANDVIASDQTSVRGAKLMKNEVFCASIGDVIVRADKAKLKIDVPSDRVVATVYVFGTEAGRELEVSNFSVGAIGANLTTGDERSAVWQLRWMVYPSFDRTVSSDLGGSKTENWIYIVDETNVVKVIKVVPEYYEVVTGNDWKLKFVSYEELRLE